MKHISGSKAKIICPIFIDRCLDLVPVNCFIKYCKISSGILLELKAPKVLLRSCLESWRNNQPREYCKHGKSSVKVVLPGFHKFTSTYDRFVIDGIQLDFVNRPTFGFGGCLSVSFIKYW